MTEFKDKTLTCRACSKPFVWTAGEQAFYKKRGLINIPARCSGCRSSRKERLGLQSQPITEVVCTECGTKTTVPFVPRNGKPVHCSSCLSKIRGRASVNAEVPAPADATM